MRGSGWLLFALLSLGCTVGEGEGWVKSDELYVDECWDGPFDLGPDFFAANSFERGKALMIRVQRGDAIEEMSDGLIVNIADLPTQRALVGTPLEVGLPVGVTPPGVPVVFDPDPAPVNLSVYLHNSCHAQNGAVYSVGGTITFRSLFSGDPQETEGDERLTEASFDASFADPRLLVGDPVADAAVTSRVTGYFRFFFQRGQPAQPF
ncbi:MAG TPA: hypothetical protein VGK73_04545 [Polyangiaceae bacterium]